MCIKFYTVIKNFIDWILFFFNLNIYTRKRKNSFFQSIHVVNVYEKKNEKVFSLIDIDTHYIGWKDFFFDIPSKLWEKPHRELNDFKEVSFNADVAEEVLRGGSARRQGRTTDCKSAPWHLYSSFGIIWGVNNFAADYKPLQPFAPACPPFELTSLALCCDNNITNSSPTINTSL